MRSTCSRPSAAYIAAIAVLLDPTDPHAATAPSTAEFPSDTAALSWLREQAQHIASPDSVTAATVLTRTPGRTEPAPTLRLGVATVPELLRTLDDLLSATTTHTEAPGHEATSLPLGQDPAYAAARALDQALDDGLTVRFTDPRDPHRLICIGMINREWTGIEYHQSDSPTRELRKIGHVGMPHYARVTDLLADLAIGAPYRELDLAGTHLPPIAVPAHIAKDLAAAQARIDALTDRARRCACDHPETLPAIRHQPPAAADNEPDGICSRNSTPASANAPAIPHRAYCHTRTT